MHIAGHQRVGHHTNGILQAVGSSVVCYQTNRGVDKPAKT